MSTLDGMSELDDSRPTLQKAAAPIVTRLTRRETILDLSTIFAWVMASDLLLYHSGGYAAWAVFALVAALVMFVAKRSLGASRYTLGVGMILVACCVRLAWCGSIPAVLSVTGLIIALSMCLNGAPPYLPDMARYCLHALVGSGFRLSRFSLRGASSALTSPRARFGVLLPLIVIVLFSLIFIRANPDVYRWIYDQVQVSMESLGRWLGQLDPLQFAFWFFSGWIAIGLFHPAAGYYFPAIASPADSTQAPSENYIAVRNTMISVVVLFAIYLAFEFSTLWFREFPKGFYYAGYAHEGAFWLTVALALSTLILSIAFSGSIVKDARAAGLKRWAWIWSLENFLLGAAVFHRLFIYIDFNGMTRMRVIGLLGTLAVIIGFGLVVYKILRGRGFLWLVRHQLWTVALAAVFYTIFPVDWAVQRHNASQILSGNPAPSTQIPTHETSAEGLLPLVALLECEDDNIRIGMQATMADWLVRTKVAKDWRDNQWANQELRDELQPHLPQLEPFLNSPNLRNTTLSNFFNYAYQWY